MRRLFLPLLLTLASGCAIAAGPTVGRALGRGTVVGWEADVGTIPLHLALGQSFRPAPPRVDGEGFRHPTGAWERVDWVAGQSWLGGGLTAGFAASELSSGARPLAGAWAALPYWPTGLHTGREGFEPFLLVGLGYRWLADAHELTLSARAGLTWFDPLIRTTTNDAL